MDATPPTLFVRLGISKSERSAASFDGNHGDSYNKGDYVDVKGSDIVESACAPLQEVVDVVLDHLWERRPALRRYSCRELLTLGSIWIDHHRQQELQQQQRSTGNTGGTQVRKRRCKKRATKFQRLTSEEDPPVFVALNDTMVILRIHAQPSRFPLEQWLQDAPNVTDRVVVDASGNPMGVVVLNKPGGIPSHPTVDNARENVLSLARTQEKQQQQQHQSRMADNDCSLSTVPHRLDTDTSGLQMVSTAKFASYMGTLLEQKTTGALSNTGQDNDSNSLATLQKRYRCLVMVFEDNTGSSLSAQEQHQRLETMWQDRSIVLHYVDKNDRRVPKEFLQNVPLQEASSTTTWLDCRLRIGRVGSMIRVARIQSIDGQHSDSIDNEDENSNGLAAFLWKRESYRPRSTTHVVELEIELLTGRTHQIRGQLASLGHSIVGDALYGGSLREMNGGEDRPLNALALQCCHLAFPRPPCQVEMERLEGRQENSKLPPLQSIGMSECSLPSAWWTKRLQERIYK